MTSMLPAAQIPPNPVKTMRAAVLVEPKRFVVQHVPLPRPGPGQVRVRLEGCGVCASNIPPWEGRPWFNYPMEPGQLGHEGWGVVDALGPQVKGLKLGDRVALLSGHAYAEYDLAPAQDVVCLPRMLHGRPFPGEPLGCTINIFRRSQIHAGSTVAIIGIGFLGANLTRLASAAGARVIAIARRPYALQVARQMSAAQCLEMDDSQRILDRVKELTDGRLCDVAIEAVGKQGPLDLAGELTRQRGRLVIAGYHQDGLRQVNMQLWNWRGIDVINAHEREQRVYIDGIRDAVDEVDSGRLNPDPLYTHRYPLERLNEALQTTLARPEGFMKALIEM